MTIGEVIELVKVIIEQLVALFNQFFGSDDENAEAEGEDTTAQA